jgi:hypothetical protein
MRKFTPKLIFGTHVFIVDLMMSGKKSKLSQLISKSDKYLYICTETFLKNKYTYALGETSVEREEDAV